MRVSCILLLAVALLLVPGRLAADEPPTEPSAREAGSTKPLTPTEAWKAIQEAVGELPAAKRRAALRSRTWAYLKEWKARDETVSGEELFTLGRLYRQALQNQDALAAFSAVAIDAQVPTRVRDLAAASEALLLLNPRARREMDAAAIQASAQRLRAHAEEMTEANRTKNLSSLRNNVASLLGLAGRKDESLELYLENTLEEPKAARWNSRNIVRNLLGRTHSMDGYPALRASAIAAMLILRHQQQAVIRAAEEQVLTLRAEGDEDGATKAENTVAGARKDLARIEAEGRPFAMLGEPAPVWTLEKAFGDVKQVTDLKGKVVVLDFWATWCSWCVKSFPAIRDLTSEYGDEGLVLVGVTASGRSVYEHRYNIDEDVKAKAKATKGRYLPKVAARLATAAKPANGETVFEEAQYRVKEQEVLAAFLRNHEVTWPVVMIDKSEPSAKYALTGWPHTVVLDRKGRVRYFKYGPLLRDKPKTLAAFKRVLEDLLAEPE